LFFLLGAKKADDETIQLTWSLPPHLPNLDFPEDLHLRHAMITAALQTGLRGSLCPCLAWTFNHRPGWLHHPLFFYFIWNPPFVKRFYKSLMKSPCLSPWFRNIIIIEKVLPETASPYNRKV